MKERVKAYTRSTKISLTLSELLFFIFQTHLELNNFVMFKDPQYFEEPERFKPERWLRDGSAKDIHPYILTPFGHGPRMCAGNIQAQL